MRPSKLRKAGNPVRLAVPPALRARPKRTLAEFLSFCHARAGRRKAERVWLNGKPVGRELI